MGKGRYSFPMSCLYCSKKSESFSRSVALGGEEYHHDFPIDDLVGNAIQVFSEIYRCSDCDSIWKIQSRGTGDPRSTYPEYYEQTATLLKGIEREAVVQPTLDNLLKLGEISMPYDFRTSVLDKLKEKEKQNLIRLYREQKPDLDSSIKFWLEKWYESIAPEEFRRFKEDGFHMGANSIYALPENSKIISSEFYTLEDFVIWVEEGEDGRSYLQSLNHKTGKAGWKTDLPAPFSGGMKLPVLFYQGGYLCTLHGLQMGSEHYSRLNRPDRLRVYSTDGELLLEEHLSWKAYEVISPEERDYSENRTVHNFRVTIWDDSLYLPSGHSLKAFDLKNKKEIINLSLPDGHIFSGKLQIDEDGKILAYTMKGFILFDAKWKILSSWKSPYHPVFMDSNMNVFYYYAHVENPRTHVVKEFQQKMESGVSLTHFLRTTPAPLPNGYFVPFAYDESYILNFDLEIVKKIPYTCTDTLGPHALDDKPEPTLVTENRLVFCEDYKQIRLFSLEGEEIRVSPSEVPFVNLFTFDGKNICFVQSNYTGYGVDDNYLLTLWNPEGQEINQVKLRSLEGFAVSFHGYLIFKYQSELLCIDLFKGI